MLNRFKKKKKYRKSMRNRFEQLSNFLVIVIPSLLWTNTISCSGFEYPPNVFSTRIHFFFRVHFETHCIRSVMESSFISTVHILSTPTPLGLFFLMGSRLDVCSTRTWNLHRVAVLENPNSNKTPCCRMDTAVLCQDVFQYYIVEAKSFLSGKTLKFKR